MKSHFNKSFKLVICVVLLTSSMQAMNQQRFKQSFRQFMIFVRGDNMFKAQNWLRRFWLRLNDGQKQHITQAISFHGQLQTTVQQLQQQNQRDISKPSMPLYPRVYNDNVYEPSAPNLEDQNSVQSEQNDNENERPMPLYPHVYNQHDDANAPQGNPANQQNNAIVNVRQWHMPKWVPPVLFVSATVVIAWLWEKHEKSKQKKKTAAQQKQQNNKNKAAYGRHA